MFCLASPSNYLNSLVVNFKTVPSLYPNNETTVTFDTSNEIPNNNMYNNARAVSSFDKTWLA